MRAFIKWALGVALCLQVTGALSQESWGYTAWWGSGTGFATEQQACETSNLYYYNNIYGTPGQLGICDAKSEQPNQKVTYYDTVYSPGVCLWRHYDCRYRQNGILVVGSSGAAISYGCNYTIQLGGSSSTKALPAGPALAQVASVRCVNEIAASRPVSISVAGGGIISGLTDAAGQFRFTYVPPRNATTAQLSASCTGCTNTATQSISVVTAEVQNTCEADAGTLLGNPIAPATGEKIQTETDYADAGAHPLNWVRIYRSRETSLALLGHGWTHNYAATIEGVTVDQTVQRRVRLADGTRQLFVTGQAGSGWTAAESSPDRLEQRPNGEWAYTRASDDSVWVFEPTGTRLLSTTQRNGWTMTMGYNPGGQLSSITNAFGRQLLIERDALGHVRSLTTPDGQVIGYTVDSAYRLTQVAYPGSTSRTYVYDDPRFDLLLSGIIDESGQRIASFTYDAEGRANGTQHAGGTQGYTFNYGAAATPAGGTLVAAGAVDPSIYRATVQVTDPLGNPQSWTYQGGDGQIRVLGANGAFMGGQAASRSFGAASTLPDSETDFLGITTLYTWDAARRLKLSETRAASRPEAQTTETQWHPTLRLPVLVSEAGRTTAYSYDAQGNKLSETVTDLATGQARTWAWTYNPQGLVATATDPAGRAWTYGYDAQGNRTSVKDPLGQESTASYDSAGRLLSQTRPNRAPVNYTYDLRGRLLSQSSGNESVAYSYTAAGLLAAMVQSDGLQVSYSYDAAQRLTGASDNRGNRVSYTLDAAGNRNLTSDGLRNFDYDPANRLSKARVFKDGEEASIRYLHNALGQRVFKGEPRASQTLPSEQELGQGFIDWLKSNFKWLFAQAQANTSIGTGYVYGDGEIPSWAILGDYDNGSAKGAGRSEYIWLPTEDPSTGSGQASAIPMGMYRNGKFFAIHTDHLGTPRLMTSEDNKPVWQWPYSAFGNNKPTGMLKATPNPKAAITNVPVLLKATGATELNLRFPGQYDDGETGTFYNYFRSYSANQGRYTQYDPIGLAGGWSRFGYAASNSLLFIDPKGLAIKCKTVFSIPFVADVQECWEDGATPSDQDARDAKRMSDKELHKACRANGYEDAHAMKNDLGLDSKSDIFSDKNGNMYSGPRKGTGTPNYLHMNTQGITPR